MAVVVQTRPRTRDEVLEVLRRLADSLGRPPTARDLVGSGIGLGRIQKLFGGLCAAREAAGLRVSSRRKPQPRWTRESAAAALRALAERLGRVPVSSDLRGVARDRPTLPVYVRLFGSFTAALREAGLGSRPDVGRSRRWTEKRCVEALREAARMLGARPTTGDIDRLRRSGVDVPSYSTLVVRFGSYSAALARAGLDRVLSRWEQARTKPPGVPVREISSRIPGLADVVAELGSGPEGADRVRAVVGERDFQFLRAYAEDGTLTAVGARFGVSRERARQVVRRAARRWLQFREDPSAWQESRARSVGRLEVLGRLARAVIENPTADYLRLAELVWGPGIPVRTARARVCYALRRLRSGLRVPGVDPGELAAALAVRRRGRKPGGRGAKVEAVVALVSARGFGVPSDLACLAFSEAKEARARLAASGIPVLRVRSRIGRLLVAAAEAGWPEVPGLESGREFARRLAVGEHVQAAAASLGLSSACVRELVRAYLERAAGQG